MQGNSSDTQRRGGAHEEHSEAGSTEERSGAHSEAGSNNETTSRHATHNEAARRVANNFCKLGLVQLAVRVGVIELEHLLRHLPVDVEPEDSEEARERIHRLDG